MIAVPAAEPRPEAGERADGNAATRRIEKADTAPLPRGNAPRRSNDFELPIPRRATADVAAENAGIPAGGARFRGGSQDQIFSATSFAVALPAQSLFAAGLAGEG